MQSSKRIIIFLLTILLLTYSNNCWADTLVASSLAQGKKINGKALELRNNKLSFLCDDG